MGGDSDSPSGIEVRQRRSSTDTPPPIPHSSPSISSRQQPASVYPPPPPPRSPSPISPEWSVDESYPATSPRSAFRHKSIPRRSDYCSVQSDLTDRDGLMSSPVYGRMRRNAPQPHEVEHLKALTEESTSQETLGRESRHLEGPRLN